MNEQEIQKLLGEVAEKNKAAISTEVKSAIAAALVDKQFAEDQMKKFKSICEEQGLKADTVKNLEEAIQKQGEALRKLSSEQEQKAETVESIVEKHADKIKAIAKEGARGAFKIEIPSMVVNKTQVTRSTVGSTTMAMRLVDVGQLAYRGLKMANLFRHAGVDSSSNGVIRFYDQATVTRAAAAVAEAATKPESAITWIERLVKVEKIADSIPVTKEAWSDVYFIQEEVNRLLNLNLAIKEDALLWGGSGVSPEISGVYTTALTNGAFDGTTATKIANANIFDLIASMKVSIMNAVNADGSRGKQSKYDPNVVVMNPADILALRLQKDSFGRYLFPADMAELYGMSIIESSIVTADTLLVGDTRYGTIYDLEGVTLEMGYINDQFVKNAMTLLAEKRETLLIRNVDADGFLACAGIAAAVGNMTKV
ncbi:MAG TPA: phage major capsid protein [Cyclobacteriaceae bacterium]|jgi:HK97 family phage major capsid protein|nr:phage major capsid protein [Cyclobacteriaceae bacterium]